MFVLSMSKRPILDTELDSKTFREYYYLKVVNR